MSEPRPQNEKSFVGELTPESRDYNFCGTSNPILEAIGIRTGAQETSDLFQS